MKEKTIVILILIFFCSCTFKNSGKENMEKFQAEDNLTTGLISDYSRSDSIANYSIDGVRQLSFKFNVDTSEQILKSIIIYFDKAPIQIIKVDEYIESPDFRLIDCNFDGYKDIIVPFSCGSGGCAYWIWNYSAENGTFYLNEELSEQLGLEIDTISKFIIFHYREGWMGEYWVSMKYINNKLTFVKGLKVEKWTDESSTHNWVKNTCTKMVNNKLVTTVDSSIINEE
jgi:hypothetical protein